MKSPNSKKRNRKKPFDPVNARLEFYEALSRGEISLAETLKRMRAIAGKTQTEYAGLIGIAPRIIMDLERGVGNPTLSTLQKIGAPFGLVLGFRKKTPILPH
jgi:DNA-binding XRE family transcriptional regulator